MQTIEQIGKRNNICDLQYIRMRIAKCPPDSVPEMVLAVDDKISCPQIQKLCQNLKQKTGVQTVAASFITRSCRIPLSERIRRLYMMTE